MASLSQIISLIVLAPLFFPAFSFCPFKLPYLYCYICPVRCMWYRLRGVVLLSVLALNIKNGFFCNSLCPFGTIQDLLSKISPKKIIIPYFFRSFKYISIVLIISLVAITKFSGPIFVVKMKYILWGVFLLGIVMSIFSYRAFCHNLCPVKALNRVLNKIKPK